MPSPLEVAANPPEMAERLADMKAVRDLHRSQKGQNQNPQSSAGLGAGATRPSGNYLSRSSRVRYRIKKSMPC